jgi:hypothetical protein
VKYTFLVTLQWIDGRTQRNATVPGTFDVGPDVTRSSMVRETVDFAKQKVGANDSAVVLFLYLEPEMSGSETDTVDPIFESGEDYGQRTEREIVKDEVRALITTYIEDLSSGRGLDDPSIRVAVVHLRQVNDKLTAQI